MLCKCLSSIMSLLCHNWSSLGKKNYNFLGHSFSWNFFFNYKAFAIKVRILTKAIISIKAPQNGTFSRLKFKCSLNRIKPRRNYFDPANLFTLVKGLQIDLTESHIVCSKNQVTKSITQYIVYKKREKITFI